MERASDNSRGIIIITFCTDYKMGQCEYKDELIAARELISRLDAQIDRLGKELYTFTLGPKMIQDIQRSAEAARQSTERGKG